MQRSLTLPRKPAVENKYNLTILKIKRLKIADRSLIREPLFWRNDVIQAWCISEEVIPSKYGDETSYWIGIYDEDAPHYAGQLRFNFSCYGGMCGYEFEQFFQPEDIENLGDLIVQEKFLSKINELLDMDILKI